MVTALQGMNELIRNFISYHSLSYADWDLFFSDFQEIIMTLSSFSGDLFVNAFSLHYIDEFEWKSESEIKPKQIFNTSSNLLPKDFFTSKLNSYPVYNCQKK